MRKYKRNWTCTCPNEDLERLLVFLEACGYNVYIKLAHERFIDEGQHIASTVNIYRTATVMKCKIHFDSVDECINRHLKLRTK